MRAVGIRLLKDRLSEYLRLVEAGETVLVTDRDRVVAELRPPSPGRAPDVSDAVLAGLIRDGLLSPAAQPGGPLPARRPVTTLRKLLAGLEEDRADRC